MIELLILGVIMLAGLLLAFKILFFVFGLIFGSLGFLLRLFLFGGIAVVCFPVLTALAAGLFSAWGVGIILAVALMAILFDKPKKQRESREYRHRYQDHHSDEYYQYRYNNRDNYR